MSLDRLPELQEKLERKYKILKGLEKAKDESDTAGKPNLQLKIDDLLVEIQPLEHEYAERISRQITQQDLSDLIAQRVVLELSNEIEIFLPISSDQEFKASLQLILLELEKANVPALSKLKIAMPRLSDLIAYKSDNIESFARRLFPVLRGCLKIRREVKNQAVSLRSMLRIMAM